MGGNLPHALLTDIPLKKLSYWVLHIEREVLLSITIHSISQHIYS